MDTMLVTGGAGFSKGINVTTPRDQDAFRCLLGDDLLRMLEEEEG